jgi:hypothetical protein
VRLDTPQLRFLVRSISSGHVARYVAHHPDNQLAGQTQVN